MSTWAWLPPRQSSSLAVPAALEGRIFVIDLPARFNDDVDTPIAMKHGVYLKAERIVHEMLLRSRAVSHPYEAALYFVPIYIGMLGLDASGRGDSGRRHARLDELSAALDAVRAAVPRLWPAHSARFVFALSLDRGRCFQDDGFDRFRDATVLMHDGTTSYPREPHSTKPRLTFPCHRRGRDIVLPPPTDLGLTTALVARAPELSMGAVARAAANFQNRTGAAAAATFPWAFFTHRKLLIVWRGSASRTAWAATGTTGGTKSPGAASSTSSSSTTMTTTTTTNSYSLKEDAAVAATSTRSPPAPQNDHARGAGASSKLDVRHAILGALGKTNASAARAAQRLVVAESHAGGGAGTRVPASAMPVLVSTRKVDKATHYAEMRRSLFCLAPAGWAQWTVRFFEAVHLGCLPVTFLPQPNPLGELRMPFDHELDYVNFSVNVPPADTPRLRHILEAIAEDRGRLRAMQRALWAARHAFDWTDTGERGPFYRVLEQLARRLS